MSPAPDAELAGEVGAKDDDVAAFVGLGERAALGVVEDELLLALVGARDLPDDLVGHAEAAAALVVPEDGDLRDGNVHAGDRGARPTTS